LNKKGKGVKQCESIQETFVRVSLFSFPVPLSLKII
jgi:hypothetical protein